MGCGPALRRGIVRRFRRDPGRGQFESPGGTRLISSCLFEELSQTGALLRLRADEVRRLPAAKQVRVIVGLWSVRPQQLLRAHGFHASSLLVDVVQPKIEASGGIVDAGDLSFER